MSEKHFLAAYKKLNEAQKKAVDTTDGTVMVIAGPGSGKTQLLAIRIANILKQTDIQPHNILCLTYTDSASYTMRARVAQFVGKHLAYQLTIGTFHSFATQVIATYPEFFDVKADYSPIARFEQNLLIRDLIETVPFSSPFKSFTQTKGYTYLSTIKDRISEIKQAGLSPTQFQDQIKHTITQCQQTSQLLLPTLIDKPKSKQVEELLEQAILVLQPYSIEQSQQYPTLTDQAYRFAIQSLEQTRTSNKKTTKFYTAWRNEFFCKSQQTYTWKYLMRSQQWHDLAHIYTEYQKTLTSKGLMDFDDMLLILKNQLIQSTELQTLLQETYQYILVDEFQDNNKVQNEIMYALGDNPINEGSPNILVVGDDDQSIYKFGGANLGVMQEFIEHYPKAYIISLTKNYRSSPAILKLANSVITQVTDRLDNTKCIQAAGDNSHFTPDIRYMVCDTSDDEPIIIAEQVQSAIAQGTQPKQIAVIAREYKTLDPIALALQNLAINYSYERSENILQNNHIQHIVHMAEYSVSLYTGYAKDYLLPKIISHFSWGVDRFTIWQLSQQAKQSSWLESIKNSSNNSVRTCAEILLSCAQSIANMNAQQSFGILLGSIETDSVNENGVENSLTSPLKSYLAHSLVNNVLTNEYSVFVQQLKALFQFITEQSKTPLPTLDQAITIIEQANQLKIPIYTTITTGTQDAPKLLTAHKAKGQEFEVVILANSCIQTWQRPKKSGIKLAWPQHTPYSPEADTINDVIRLLYVAITRAKQTLIAVVGKLDSKAKPLTTIEEFDNFIVTQTHNTKQKNHTQEIESQLFPLSEPPYALNESQLLQTKLERLKLSPTALLTFLNLQQGGPSTFVERHLLGFPTAVHTSMVFGTVIHSVFEILLQNVVKNNPLSLKQAQDLLPELFKSHGLQGTELTDQIEHAKHTLELAYKTILPYWTTNDVPEYNFGKDNVIIEGAPMTGKIDRIHISTKGIDVFDYKTGKPLSQKNGSDKDWAEFQYKLQFYCYKFALEQSSQFKNLPIRSGTFIFVESKKGETQLEEFVVTPDAEYEKMIKKLIGTLWYKIKSLELPTQTELAQFSNSYDEFDTKSSLGFKKWLLDTYQ